MAIGSYDAGLEGVDLRHWDYVFTKTNRWIHF